MKIHKSNEKPYPDSMTSSAIDNLAFVIPFLGDGACLRDTLRHLRKHYPQAFIYVIHELDKQPAFRPANQDRSISYLAVPADTQIHEALAELFLKVDVPFLVLLREDTLLSPHIDQDLQEATIHEPNLALATPLSDGFSPNAIPLIPGTDVTGTRQGLSFWDGGPTQILREGLGCTLCFSLQAISGATWARLLGTPSTSLASFLEAEGKSVKVLTRAVAHQSHFGFKSLEKQWQLLFNKLGFQLKSHLSDRIVKPMPEFRRVLPWQARHRDWYGCFRETARLIKKRSFKLGGLNSEQTLFKSLSRIWGHPRATMPLWARLHYESSNALKVIYLVEDLVVAGGVFSIVQLTNELWMQGIEARIAFLNKAHEIQDWRFCAAPFQFRNRHDLLTSLPKCDVVVATFWTGASLAAELVKSGRAKTSAYFVQDFEPWFYPEKNPKRDQALASYDLIPNRIVKSDWLQKLLKEHGHESYKIHLGLDRDIFFSANPVTSTRTPTKNGRKLRILAMARPSTPRRGFDTLLGVLSELLTNGDSWEVALFGDDYLSRRNLPFQYRDLGVIRDHHYLAETYRNSDIFLETSDFQGFGRTSLEAMACGCACILTNVGGLHEYATDGENCLLVPPKNQRAIVQALRQLRDDPELRAKLSIRAQTTTTNFDHIREAKATALFLTQLLEKVP